MPFFQNPFFSDFRGNLVLGDRQYSLTFKCPLNSGRGKDIVSSWEKGPFDLSGQDADGNDSNILTILFALSDSDFKSWINFSVTLSDQNSVDNISIINSLNGNSIFASYFEASLNSSKEYIHIRQKLNESRFTFYIKNTGAEEKIRFNKKAPIVDLPSYMARHGVNKSLDFDDCANVLVPLYKEATAITAADPAVITSAGHGLDDGMEIFIANSNVQSYDDLNGEQTVDNSGADVFDTGTDLSGDSIAGYYAEIYSPLNINLIAGVVDYKGNSLNMSVSNAKTDYELLKGESGIFQFKKIWHDDEGRIVKEIVYSAGAKVGDLAQRNTYLYNEDLDVNPIRVTQEPWVLKTSDLVTPDWTGATVTS